MSDPSEAVFARFPVLETPRLILRESRLTDADAIFAALSQEKVTRHYNISALTSVDQARAIVQRRAEAFARRERIRWALARREEDGVIGSCGYVYWSQADARAEIGYEMAGEWQGQGLMREALGAMLAFGFGPMQLNLVEALVVPENLPSRRLLQHMGFQQEGLLREHGFWKGRFHDLLLFSLLKKDRHE